MLTTHYLQKASARLSSAGIDTPTLDARLLLGHATGLSREEMLANPDHALTPAQAQAFEALIARRAGHEPLAHITGHREFFELDFIVTRDTLIPRPDSETVLEAVLERVPRVECLEYTGTRHSSPVTILDLGTGTGCLLLSLLHALPGATGTGVDASEAALSVARRNADALQLSDRATFLQSDWCAQLPPKKYEIVVANPPYIVSDALRTLMPEVSQFEPKAALDGGADGLECYRKIASQLPPYLAEHAIIAVEAGAGQAQAISGIFEACGFRAGAVKQDLSGIPRCVMFSK